MPELPEVETMVRGLRPAMAGRTLSHGSRSTTRSCFQGCDGRGLPTPRPRGAWSIDVGRRGKWVVI